MAVGKVQSSAEPDLASSTMITALPDGGAASREEVLLIGSAGNLMSIITRPATARTRAAEAVRAAPAPSAAVELRSDAGVNPGTEGVRAGAEGAQPPTVIFLNAGVIHRVGPHRLHVTLARELAAGGSTAIRVDLSGIGDSRPLSGDLSFRQRSVSDARATMDEATAAGAAPRFVLFGLCSGADNAVATALADDRVVGVVLVDPFTYPTLPSVARKVAVMVRRLGGPRRVVLWGAGIVARRARGQMEAIKRRVKQGGRPAEAEEEPAQNGREVPPKDVFGAQLGALERRGVKILALYSGTHGDRYNHPDQVFEMFPHLRGKIERQYYPDVNHTFTELAAQRRLRATVTDWVNRQFR